MHFDIYYEIKNFMQFHAAFFGHGLSADMKASVFSTAIALGQTLARLDNSAKSAITHPAWLKVEQQAALAAAAREIGQDAGLDWILRVRMGAASLPIGHARLTSLDERGQSWSAIARRKGSAPLRDLVKQLVPARGQRDLVALAEAVRAAAEKCVSHSHLWMDSLEQGSLRASDVGDPLLPDAGDVAMATSFALRRAGFLSAHVPSLCGRPKLLLREHDPLELLQTWMRGLMNDAEEAQARLTLLERHYWLCQRKIQGQRRAPLLMRIVDLSYQQWSLWSLQASKALDVDGSTAWRALGLAADMGLVASVSLPRKTRGDAVLYVAPPLLTMAKLIARPRPYRIDTLTKQRSPSVLERLDQALSDIDVLLPAKV